MHQTAVAAVTEEGVSEIGDWCWEVLGDGCQDGSKSLFERLHGGRLVSLVELCKELSSYMY